jgi:hypothetical protein
MRKSHLSFVAVFLLLAGLAGTAFAAQAPVPQSGQLSGEYSIKSDAFKGNVLGDPIKRNVSFTLPPSYWQKNPDGSFVHPDYPIVLLLSGNNMYRNEGTIDAILEQRCHPADGSPSLMSAANQAKYCGTTIFDQDTIAYNLMATGQTPEFILLETSILSRMGGTRYYCSSIFGDHRTFLMRDIPQDAEQRFRIRPGRENWFLMGFSGGAGGALMMKLEDREDRWGQLGLLSPSNNDLSLKTAPNALGKSEPSLLNRFRNSLGGHIPQTNIPVHKVSGPDEIAESWGNFIGAGKFTAGSVITMYQSVLPDPSGTIMAEDGVTPLYTVNPLTGPNVGDYDAYLWDTYVQPQGLKQMVLRASDNLIDTVVVVGRGNNKESLDPAAPVNLVLLSEIGDQPNLISTLTSFGFLDAQFQMPGDHFTSVPNTFPVVVKELFARAGSKNGRPFTFNPTIEQEHSSCAVQFPRESN